MFSIINAFVRALGHLLLPRVIGMSLLPLLLMVALWFGLHWLFWDSAVAAMQDAIKSWAVFGWLGERQALDWPGGVAALLVWALITPVIVLISLLAVSMLMTPALARLVVKRRFPALERRRGASAFGSAVRSAGALLAALLALVLTSPLWLMFTPLTLVLPPLIWGWLTYRVMSFDALAEFADADERRALLRRHRWPLLVIGIVSGYMGAAPSVVWASGTLFVALFGVLAPLAIWIYTVVFAFSSLWFSHYCLWALDAMRTGAAASSPPEQQETSAFDS
ncbi:MAG: EI24 domain-containing protein [Proteobacteria bacterium]|nr:EI24 domain-containing protein [Pseudomonadota bacterium]